uniref:RNA-binding protein 48 n=1 Tax=Schistocephalus solidus TaxID=70667 RepID=A0A0V0JA02_SCHSO
MSPFLGLFLHRILRRLPPLNHPTRSRLRNDLRSNRLCTAAALIFIRGFTLIIKRGFPLAFEKGLLSEGTTFITGSPANFLPCISSHCNNVLHMFRNFLTLSPLASHSRMYIYTSANIPLDQRTNACEPQNHISSQHDPDACVFL